MFSFSQVLPKIYVLPLFILILVSFLGNHSFGQCDDDTVSLGPDQYFCSEVNTILSPEIISTDSVISYYWYQNDELLDSASALEVNTADTYVLNVIFDDGCEINDSITLSILELSGGLIAGEQILCNSAEAETLTSISLPGISTSNFGAPMLQWQEFTSTGICLLYTSDAATTSKV